MKYSKSQEGLFPDNYLDLEPQYCLQTIKMDQDMIKDWQTKIFNYQSEFFKAKDKYPQQKSLFKTNEIENTERFEPLKLSPLPISFWRQNRCSHNGPAIYVVMDRPPHLKSYLILYIGETIAAEKRWKGEHDCKNYISSYSEALASAGLKSQLSIRFWADVPKETKPRRKLEQLLIQLWQPPFNKETRERWSTPFTVDV